MERREFIKKGCFACMALGTGVLATTLSSCSSLPIIQCAIDQNRIPFDPAAFTEDVNAVLLRTKKFDHDILLRKNADETYRAIYMECTHNKYDLSSNKKQIFCTSHGAEFDFEGNVTKGPAVQKLKSFPVVSEAGKLFVHLV